MKLSITKPVLRYENGQTRIVDDPVVVEYALTVMINDVMYVKLLCSPQELYELVTGYLYGEGLIASIDDLLSLHINPEAGVARAEIRRTPDAPAHFGLPVAVASGAGQQQVAHDAVFSRRPELLPDGVCFDSQALLRNLKQFYANSTLHSLTAGVHCAALCDDTGTCLTAIDISRHNAFDKVLGMALRKSIPLPRHYLITSGRTPSDMVRKAVFARLPMLVSRAASTDRAILLAQETNLTLLGFSRENRFSIYHGSHRVIIQKT